MDIIKESDDMEEITHFSHKNHPLKLLKSNEIVGAHFHGDGSGVDEKPRLIVCYACKNPISSGFAYGCIKCRYYLHKACTQLPATINMASLYEHPLTLIDFRTTNFRSWTCDVCRNQNFGGFSYSFTKTGSIFTACIPCCVIYIALKAEKEAIKEEARMKVEHKGHPQHTLSLQLRHAAFLCDACNTYDDEGLFYACDSCDFWIHKTCASLDPTINLPDHHNHPLVLVYSLPEKFFRFPYYCEFCNKYVRRNDWLYHCANCRYFFHIKCALNAKRGAIASDSESSSMGDESIKDLLHFPMSNAFTDPLKLLHSKMVAPHDDKETMIDHWSHSHPLILNVERQPNLSDNCDEIEVCDGCVRPLSSPYYSCKDGCSFTLHKYCAELPKNIEHQLHPDHPLHLINTRRLWYFYRCIGCDSYGNSFVYQCQTCKFYLDVSCAFLPKTIKHKSHKHPLVQVIDPQPVCCACKTWSENMSYACKDCNFTLGMYCAMRLPNSLVHRYCKGHEIPLAYPPVMDHPEDFFCDICETEMHPKLPLYYCPKCKNSFHLKCISNQDYYENVVLKGIKNVYSHKHPLTCIRRKRTPKYVCSKCNRDNNGRLVLECRARVCNFNICFHCYPGW